MAFADKPERRGAGDALGLNRIVGETGRLPQGAERLDNSLPIYSNEVLIEVERLNIDAASFVQMDKETRGDAGAIGRIVLENTRTRGKQHNRVTGSGGMLVGMVAQIGSHYHGPLRARVGDRVASLVSLTLTPLHLESIRSVDLKTHQIEVTGHAILFETAIAAVLPQDLPERVAMAVFDVAGAPATVDGLCAKGETLVIIGGGGKAGILSCVAGRQRVGPTGKVIAVEPFARAAEELKSLGICDAVIPVDATDPIAVQRGVMAATDGKMGDVVVNVASVPDTEIGSILSARDSGKILFFGMATSFTKVTLGAEGIACNATLLFGNGYYPNHDRFAIELVRGNAKLRELFQRRYGG